MTRPLLSSLLAASLVLALGVGCDHGAGRIDSPTPVGSVNPYSDEITNERALSYPPWPPGEVSVTLTGSRVHLQWLYLTDVHHFVVYRKGIDEEDWVRLKAVSPIGDAVGTQATFEFEDDDVPMGTLLIYGVSVVVHESGMESEITATSPVLLP